MVRNARASPGFVRKKPMAVRPKNDGAKESLCPEPTWKKPMCQRVKRGPVGSWHDGSIGSMSMMRVGVVVGFLAHSQAISNFSQDFKLSSMVYSAPSSSIASSRIVAVEICPTSGRSKATLAWDFFHGQFTKQNCPLFFRYIEDKAQVASARCFDTSRWCRTFGAGPWNAQRNSQQHRMWRKGWVGRKTSEEYHNIPYII